MRLPRSLIRTCIALATIAAAWSSQAQSGPQGMPTHIRGTVETLDGQKLVVMSREGSPVSVTLAKDFHVNMVVRAQLADIRRGDFIGAAAVQTDDGMLHAQEVLIFPEAARGTGEGHYPWDLTPGDSMTNATVAEVTGTAEGRKLKLSYKGGKAEMEVLPQAPIVTFRPGSPALLTRRRGLRPGAEEARRHDRRQDRGSRRERGDAADVTAVCRNLEPHQVGSNHPKNRHGRACPGHPRLAAPPKKAWMPGTSPGMTRKDGSS